MSDPLFVFTGRLEEIATDVGRLRRRLAPEPDSSLAFTLDRIGHNVECLDAFVQPSAADLFRFYVTDGELDEQRAVEAALETVDRRTRQLQGLLAKAAA